MKLAFGTLVLGPHMWWLFHISRMDYGLFTETSTKLPKQQNNIMCFAGATPASVPCECRKSFA